MREGEREREGERVSIVWRSGFRVAGVVPPEGEGERRSSVLDPGGTRQSRLSYPPSCCGGTFSVRGALLLRRVSRHDFETALHAFRLWCQCDVSTRSRWSHSSHCERGRKRCRTRERERASERARERASEREGERLSIVWRSGSRIAGVVPLHPITAR